MSLRAKLVQYEGHQMPKLTLTYVFEVMKRRVVMLLLLLSAAVTAQAQIILPPSQLATMRSRRPTSETT